MKIIKISKNDANLRLDNFIMKVYPSLSRGNVFKVISNGKVKVNNKRQKYSYHLCLNDEIKCYLDEYKTTNADDLYLQAKDNLEVVYEDDNLLVVNKPVKLIVVDEDNKVADTLINRAKKYLLKNKKWDPKKENHFAPCLVHRIDFNTSGLVIIAKTHEASVVLSQKIKDREISKFYQCLVYGKMPKKQELLEAYLLKPVNSNLVKVSTKSIPGSKYIATKYKVLSYDAKQDISLLEVELVTGRTHQIRAHLSFVGHPLVGETKYITKNFNKLSQYKYQALVAYKLKFNFTTDAGNLANLDKKEISLKKVKFA